MKHYIAIAWPSAYLVTIKGSDVNWMAFAYPDEVRRFAMSFAPSLAEEILKSLIRAKPDNKERFEDATFFCIN